MVVATTTVDGEAVLVLGLSRAEREALETGHVLTLEGVEPAAGVRTIIVFAGETDESMEADMLELDTLVQRDRVLDN